MKESVKHIVKKGESLYKIAEIYYGEGFLWDIIYRKNIHIIGSNPDLIFEGQVLEIPCNIFLR